MQRVLNAPMITQRFSIDLGAGFATTDEVADFTRGLSLNRPLTQTHADSGQTGPLRALPQCVGVMEHGIRAILLASMAPLARRIHVVLQTGKVLIESLAQCLLDILQEMLLVVLHSQDVVGTAIEDLLGNGLLATH